MRQQHWSVFAVLLVLCSALGRRLTANAWFIHPQHPKLRTRQTHSYHCGRRHDDNEISLLCSSNVDLESHNNAEIEILGASAQSKPNDLIPQGLVDAIQSLSETTAHPMDARRIFHGRGGYYGVDCDHLTLDLFPPVFLLTSFDIELSDDMLNQIQDLLVAVVSDKSSNAFGNNDDESSSRSLSFVYQFRGEDPTNGRQLCTTTLLAGSIPKPHIVTEVEGQLKYYVNLLNNQNHGLFLDMLEGRNWVLEHCRSKSVLNMFAYTCAFSIAASHGGATEVINIDMAKGALKLGQKNHDLNARSDEQNGDEDGKDQESPEPPPSSRVRFLAHDIFKSWGKITKLGPYDIVIVDPPSYQKGSFIASKDYAKLVRRLPKLVTAEGGCVVLCLNAPELSTSFLHDLMLEEAPEFQFIKRVSNPRTFPVIDQERSLKILIYERNKACATTTTS